MSLAMTRKEREAFVAGVHIAVVSFNNAGSGPLTAPIWYGYEPGGEISFVIGKDSRKASLIQDGDRASFCVQDESPPYKYVSVEGPVRIASPDYERDIRALAHRYLGPEFGERYLSGRTPGDTSGQLLVRLTPERWLTTDYGKM